MGKNFKTKAVTVSTDDERLFPVSDNSVNDSWKEAVIAVFGKNEVDPTTGRSTHHIHQLRKFFISQLSLVTSESVADFFAGHKTALSDNYRRYTAKQMSEYYLKGEHMLYIEAPTELREAASTTKKELEGIKDSQNTLNSQMIALMLERDSLKKKLVEQNEAMATKIAQLESMLKPVFDSWAEQAERGQ
jgi:hypothetical protein